MPPGLARRARTSSFCAFHLPPPTFQHFKTFLASLIPFPLDFQFQHEAFDKDAPSASADDSLAVRDAHAICRYEWRELMLPGALLSESACRLHLRPAISTCGIEFVLYVVHVFI